MAKDSYNDMIANIEIELIECEICKGKGIVSCCDGHMCPGTKQCYECDGRGERLSDKCRAIKKSLKKLMEYK